MYFPSSAKPNQTGVDQDLNAFALLKIPTLQRVGLVWTSVSCAAIHSRSFLPKYWQGCDFIDFIFAEVVLQWQLQKRLQFIVTSTTTYTQYKAQTKCKTRSHSQGMILSVFLKNHFSEQVCGTRDPPLPPSLKKTILNFRFDYWNSSL